MSRKYKFKDIEKLDYMLVIIRHKHTTAHSKAANLIQIGTDHWGAEKYPLNDVFTT